MKQTAPPLSLHQANHTKPLESDPLNLWWNGEIGMSQMIAP